MRVRNPTPALSLRDATAGDAAACAAVYAPYVTDTVVTFELEPPPPAELAARIAAAQRRHLWLVAEVGGTVRGYAYAGTHRPREAYRWTCETSVYLAPQEVGQGLGRALYGELLHRLAGLGYRTAVAGMTLPNPASERLHAALGFTPVGTFARVGHKHGRWQDVGWVQCALGDPAAPPGPVGGEGPPRRAGPHR